MKKLLSILVIVLISNLYAGFFEGVENPNGKPWLLTLGFGNVTKFEAKLPVSNFMTISFNTVKVTSNTYNSSTINGYLLDNLWIESSLYFDSSEFSEMCDGPNYWDCIYGFSLDNFSDISSDISIHGNANYVRIPTAYSNKFSENYKIEFHIPLYKIWK